MSSEEEILFYEKQKFNPWIRVIIFISTCGIFVSGLFVQLVLQQPFGSKPLSNGGHVLGLLFALLFSGFFESMKLETVITRQSVSVRFFPFIIKWRVFRWDQMQQVSVRTYEPLFEYGGWGVKGFGDNLALNVAGNEGLQLVYENGKRLLIGTQKRSELEEVLRRIN